MKNNDQSVEIHAGEDSETNRQLRTNRSLINQFELKKNPVEIAISQMPNRDTFRLIFNKASANYKTEKFLEIVRDFTKSLMRSFEATVGETIFLDKNTINLISEICGNTLTKKLKEELFDKTQILVVRTANRSLSNALEEQATKSPGLHILNGELIRLRIEKRTQFKSNCLLVPIVVNFGFEEEKTIGRDW